MQNMAHSYFCWHEEYNERKRSQPYRVKKQKSSNTARALVLAAKHNKTKNNLFLRFLLLLYNFLRISTHAIKDK